MLLFRAGKNIFNQKPKTISNPEKHKKNPQIKLFIQCGCYCGNLYGYCLGNSTVLRISEAKRKKIFYFNWMFGYQMNVEDSKHSFFFVDVSLVHLKLK